jgi:hypothetical protein
MKTAHGNFDAKHLGTLIGSSLASGYIPTLSRPEQRAMADAFDAAMLALGKAQRAWRGVKPSKER